MRDTWKRAAVAAALTAVVAGPAGAASAVSDWVVRWDASSHNGLAKASAGKITSAPAGKGNSVHVSARLRDFTKGGTCAYMRFEARVNGFRLWRLSRTVTNCDDKRTQLVSFTWNHGVTISRVRVRVCQAPPPITAHPELHACGPWKAYATA